MLDSPSHIGSILTIDRAVAASTTRLVFISKVASGNMQSLFCKTNLTAL